MNTTHFVQAPMSDLPHLPDWDAPSFTDLATPSLTAAALTRAHATLADGVDARTRRVRDHAEDLAAFASAVRGVDADHAHAFRGK
ncbi:hypothetical protein QYQ98_04950 [Corynebacterium sp. P3-F1]|uniref:hypothetical protein n=1 Tax=Corynebacterium sp. P3-F1 TaxID=3059080 RepID=UPI00265CD49F|nr:hypothetical protein [Corynebacterium sp. P3-F1]WKK62216.1 hypothetical protein QYQ98_04950 [Corynebacterium sp. P3-F1]